MLQIKEYVVIIEDEQGAKVSEFCFNKVEQAYYFMRRYNTKIGEVVILVERMM